MIKERSLYSSQDTAPPIELTVCTNDNVAHHSKKHNPIMPTVKIEPLMIETILITVLIGAFPLLLSDVRDALMTQTKHVG